MQRKQRTQVFKPTEVDGLWRARYQAWEGGRVYGGFGTGVTPEAAIANAKERSDDPLRRGTGDDDGPWSTQDAM